MTTKLAKTQTTILREMKQGQPVTVTGSALTNALRTLKHEGYLEWNREALQYTLTDKGQEYGV